MNAFQIVRDNANHRALLFFIKYGTLLGANAQFVILKAVFDGKMTAVEAAKLIKYIQVTPTTDAKTDARNLIVTTVIPFAEVASVQAFNLDLKKLSESLDKPEAYLMSASDSDLIGRSRDLKKIMADNISVLTDLTPANIITMETVIADFEALRNLPKNEIRQKKALGTNPIPGLLDDIDEIKHQIGKIIHSKFPLLYESWLEAIKVGKAEGTRKTSLIVSYIDAFTGVALKKIKTTVTRGDIVHEKFSSKLGFSRFYGITSGGYTITSAHKLYFTDKKTNVGVGDTGVAKLEIKMRALNQTGTVKMMVLNSANNTPLVNVKVNIPEFDYLGVTDKNGKLMKDHIPPGTYVGTITLDNFRTIEFSVTVELNQTVELEFFMEKEED